MDSKLFMDLLDGLGEFHCVKDRRRFNKKKHDRYALAAYNMHFGHCKNGNYHSCEFVLEPRPERKLYNYYRKVCDDAGCRRHRSLNPIKTAGRGRRRRV